MRQFTILSITVVALVTVLVLPGQAQLLVNPATRCEVGYCEFGGAAGFAKVEYDEGYVERGFIGGYGAYGLNDWIDVYGSLGWILEAEPENWDDSGMGLQLAAGARGSVISVDVFDILAYGQFQFTKENYGEHSEEDVSFDGEGFFSEIIIGTVAIYDVTQEFSVYGGLEIIPFSDGEIEGSSGGESDTADVKRDWPVTARIGTNYDMRDFFMRAELAVGSETTLLVGGGFPF